MQTRAYAVSSFMKKVKKVSRSRGSSSSRGSAFLTSQILPSPSPTRNTLVAIVPAEPRFLTTGREAERFLEP